MRRRLLQASAIGLPLLLCGCAGAEDYLSSINPFRTRQHMPPPDQQQQQTPAPAVPVDPVQRGDLPPPTPAPGAPRQ